MTIYVTGDTHGKATRFSTRKWEFGKSLNRDDLVIIAGDFGFVRDGSKTDSYWLDWFESKPLTTCFVDGNHKRDFWLTDPLQQFLEELNERVRFKRWIHGHYHLDKKIDKRHREIHGDIIPIDSNIPVN